MDGDAELVAVLGELLGHLDAHALLDVVQDLLVAGLVADQQQPQAAVLELLQRLARHIGFRIARPGDAELAQLLGDGLGPRQVVGEGVVVEEEFLGLREGLHRPGDLVDHVLDGAGAVAVAAHGLGPQAEGAARLAAPACVDRDVGMLEVPDEVLLHLQVPLVDRGDPGKVVHLLEDRAVLVVDHDALLVAPAEALDFGPGRVVGDFLDGEVELVARDEVDDGRLDHAAVRLHRHLGADQPGLEVRIGSLQRLDGLHVRLERRHRGVKHRHVEVLGHGHDVREALAVRRRVDQLGLLDQRGGLGQPGRIPEGADLPLGLVARAGAAVETVE